MQLFIKYLIKNSRFLIFCSHFSCIVAFFLLLLQQQNEALMKKGIIIGREREMAELQRSMESDRSEFVIVYGRRRVERF